MREGTAAIKADLDTVNKQLQDLEEIRDSLSEALEGSMKLDSILKMPKPEIKKETPKPKAKKKPVTHNRRPRRTAEEKRSMVLGAMVTGENQTITEIANACDLIEGTVGDTLKSLITEGAVEIYKTEVREGSGNTPSKLHRLTDKMRQQMVAGMSSGAGREEDSAQLAGSVH